MSQLLSRYQLHALLLSVVIAMTSYLVFSLWSGWHQVSLAFLKIGIAGTLIALTLSLLNYLLRFCRWQLYLQRMNVNLAIAASLRIYLAGFSLTTTPGKAGEMIRALLLNAYQVRTSTTLSAFVSERLSDLLAIVLLALLGLSQYPQWQPLVILTLLLIITGLGLLGNKAIIQRINTINIRPGTLRSRLCTLITTVLQQARRCHSPSLLLIATALSLIAWGAEALAFYYVLQWLSLEVSFATAAFIYAISMLAGALSFLPGGLGSAEAVMVSLLTMNDMLLADAVAATVFTRLVTLWFAVILGIIALWRSQSVQHDGGALR